MTTECDHPVCERPAGSILRVGCAAGGKKVFALCDRHQDMAGKGLLRCRSCGEQVYVEDTVSLED